MGGVLNKINEKKIRKIAFIVANAKTAPDAGFDRRDAAPGFTDALIASATTPMDNYTFETIEYLRETFKQLAKGSAAQSITNQPLKEYCRTVNLSDEPDRAFNLELCTVIVSFDLLKDGRERYFFSNLGTNFHLPRETVDCLRQVAGKLLTESPEFGEFIADLDARLPAVPYDQAIIDKCLNDAK